MRILVTAIAAALAFAACSKDDGGTGPSSATPEGGTNPQVWTALAGDIALPGQVGQLAFSPTKTVRVGNKLRTYFVRASDQTVVFAESNDGKSLSTVTATNIQRASVVGDRYLLGHPTVMQRADGKFLMLYDYTYDNTKTNATRLMARVSDDGITFGNAVQLPVSDLDKSPGSGTYFVGVTGLVTMSDGSIRAYYTAGGASIASSRTTDGGATWTEDSGYRLSANDGKTGYIDVTAVKDTDGSILLYFGYVKDFTCTNGAGTAQGCASIRLARSTDGLNFTVYPGNVLTPGSGPVSLQDPDVFLSIDGKWRMLYGEYTGGSSVSVRLKMAERQ